MIRTKMERVFKPCFRMLNVFLSRIKIKYVCIGFGIVMVLDFFGVFDHVLEKTFDENFSYPYHGDVHHFVAELRRHRKPDVDPINVYDYPYVHVVEDECDTTEFSNLRLIFLIKSAVDNFDRRHAIRNSWGFEKRFFDVPTRTIFLLGTRPGDIELQAKVKAESSRHRDIVQSDFIDAYYNNTIKTMTGFKWAVDYCGKAKFYVFVDDDMYVSVKNILRFVRHPTYYPDYLKEAKQLRRKRSVRNVIDVRPSNISQKHIIETGANTKNSAADERFINENRTMSPNGVRHRRQVFDFELPDDVRLFAGFVFTSAPHRHKTSKWYVSLEEYPYHLWPPYITAGAYVLSREALFDMYYTSMYTKHFRFDDIYLGLVAKKAEIEPFHCEEFHFYKKDYTKYNYKYVITSHGYDDPNELLRVWNEQKSMGNA